MTPTVAQTNTGGTALEKALNPVQVNRVDEGAGANRRGPDGTEVGQVSVDEIGGRDVCPPYSLVSVTAVQGPGGVVGLDDRGNDELPTQQMSCFTAA